MKYEGVVRCTQCGKEIEYVRGESCRISSGRIPQAVSVPEGKLLIWDEPSYIKCPQCGNRIRMEYSS